MADNNDNLYIIDPKANYPPQTTEKQQLEKTKAEINKLQPPTPLNYEIWAMWNKGIDPETIAQNRNTSIDGVYYHIKTVNKYLKSAVNEQALMRARSKYDKVVDKWSELVEAGHPYTINNAMNKDIFPDKSERHKPRQINQTLIADKLQINNYSGQAGNNSQAVDADCEIEDTD